ncbi:aspartate/glutamate racemase family protein [Comamonas sp. MYb396]|uniref:aspartate/glutamate racemase family protein n=1 Tax=Comamonas sp. MYb396 TaxID=2745302 RepID=UPI0030B48FD0
MNTSKELPVVRVFNPNTSATVTTSIAKAIGSVTANLPCCFVFSTARSGPEGIVTQEDYDFACGTVANEVTLNQGNHDAFVVACFSDPGVDLVRRSNSDAVVLGLGECGLREALTHGERVGIVAIADAAIPRHMRHWERLGLREHVAAERALNLPVNQSGSAEIAWEALVSAGRALRDIDGANTILLGCAGMADLRGPLEEELKLPVIDPCAAAAMVAFKRVQRVHT